MKLKEGMSVTLSVCELYKKFGEELTHHSIRFTPVGEESDSCEYYDLLNDKDDVVCMDGETCTVSCVEKSFIILENEDGKQPEYITLTTEEADVGVFVNP